MQQEWVSDAVWEQLDPRAGALSRTQWKTIVAGCAATVLLGAAAYSLDRSRVVDAQIRRTDAGWSGATSVNPKIIVRQFTVKNTGWTTARIVGFGKDGPGLKLLGPGDVGGPTKYSDIPSPRLPFDLGPGQSTPLVIYYAITDCGAVPSDSFPIPIRVDRPWGTQTIDIHLQPSYVTQGEGFQIDPPEIGWQKAMADSACGVRH
jgi:hypothetical protein